jgi:hypothetical protein
VSKRCQYAYPDTYGHECGAPATHVMVHEQLESTRQALLNLGVTPPVDGLSRVGRCERHRGVVEFGDGAFIRNDEIE